MAVVAGLAVGAEVDGAGGGDAADIVAETRAGCHLPWLCDQLGSAQIVRRSCANACSVASMSSSHGLLFSSSEDVFELDMPTEELATHV